MCVCMCVGVGVGGHGEGGEEGVRCLTGLAEICQRASFSIMRAHGRHDAAEFYG